MRGSRTLIALVVAEAVSSTGSAMTFVALPWFVLATGGSATRLSLVLAAEILPLALFGIPSGTVVGKLGARTTMLVSDLARAPLVALVPILHWSGNLTFPLLLVIVFALGAFTAPYVASQRSIVPELFHDDEVLVSKASALLGAASQLPLVLGPALAGVLIASLGSPSVLLVDAVTFLAAFAIVLGFVRGGRRLAPGEDAGGLFAGVRYLSRDRLLGSMTLSVIVLDAAANCLAVAVPLLAFTRYDQNAHVAGWIFSAFGVGALLGTVVTMKLLDRMPPLRLACAAILALTVPFWVIAAPIPWAAACAAVVVSGFFVPMCQAPTMGLLTTRPPAALRAKVLTVVLTASGIGGPLGRLAVGPIFRFAGNTGVWLAIASVLSLGAVLFVAAVVTSGAGSAPVPAAAADAVAESWPATQERATSA